MVIHDQKMCVAGEQQSCQNITTVECQRKTQGEYIRKGVLVSGVSPSLNLSGCVEEGQRVEPLSISQIVRMCIVGMFLPQFSVISQLHWMTDMCGGSV